MKPKFYILILIFLITGTIYSQKDWMLKGYLKGMTAMQTIENGNMSLENTLHNRLDFDWYINDHFTFNAAMCEQIASEPNAVVPQECRNYSEKEADKAFNKVTDEKKVSDKDIKFDKEKEQ